MRGLQVKDYNPNNRTLFFRFDVNTESKKKVVANPPVSNILDYVIKELRLPNRYLIKYPFWDSNEERPLGPRSIQRIIKVEIEKLNIDLPNITIRAMRHYAGLRYTLSGASAFTLRELMGKLDNQTIASYKKMTNLSHMRGFY